MKHLRAAEWFPISVLGFGMAALAVIAAVDVEARARLAPVLWWLIPLGLVAIAGIVWVRLDRVRAEMLTRGAGDGDRPPTP